MTSSGPVDIHVEFAELGRVHTELQTLLAQVESLTGRPIHTETGQTGHAGAANAVNAFAAHGAGESRGLAAHLRDCLAVVEAALQNYETTERTLAGQEVIA